MPRVHTVTARASKFARTCDKCSKPIEVGQRHHHWSFRYGGTYYRHVDCGYPRPSDLTQSKLASVYAAREDAEDTLEGLEFVAGETQGSDIIDEINEALNSVAEAAREVADEYREAAVNPNTGATFNTDAEERADELDSYVDNLESWSASAGDDPDVEDDMSADERQDACDSWLEEVVGEAQDALQELSL